MIASQSARIPTLILTALLLVQPGAAQPENLAMDTPTAIAGIESVCTGVGLDARENPLWGTYALKVEIAGGGGHYLGDERVSLRQNGKELLSLICAGPWILFQVPPGRYEVKAEIDGHTASSAAFVSSGGQGRIILRFPDAEVPPYAMNYTDEAAQALGIRNGRIDAFSLHPAPNHTLVPSVQGGVNKKGAGLQLQWKTD